MTIRYEVTIDADAALHDAVDQYMLTRHLDQMYATGCFTSIRFERTDDRRRSVYECAEQSDLDHYLDTHAPAMRADFAEHFPSGAVATREVWNEVRVWPGA
jgi:hypothetical protein